MERCQLISYIAPAAPATRRPATGSEPFLCPEIGFTPNWYRANIGIDFGRKWHKAPPYRLCGERVFYDMVDSPRRCRHLFDCICTTMIGAAKRLTERQLSSAVEIAFSTVSNCLVNMVLPKQYRDLLLPSDQRIAEALGCIGIHNCAWNSDPYIDDYAPRDIYCRGH